MSTVMIVDDSKTSRFMLRNILVEHGYEVVAEAENGQEGYEKYCELRPDFVTLDITMPIMDGIETLQKFETTEGNRNLDTPVIALTANAVTGAREMYMENGFTDFLAKPIVYEKLEKLLLKYLPKEKVKCL